MLFSFGGASYTREGLIHERDLYTSGTYTRVRCIHEWDLDTSGTYTRVGHIHKWDVYTSGTYTKAYKVELNVKSIPPILATRNRLTK